MLYLQKKTSMFYSRAIYRPNASTYIKIFINLLHELLIALIVLHLLYNSAIYIKQVHVGHREVKLSHVTSQLGHHEVTASPGSRSFEASSSTLHTPTQSHREFVTGKTEHHQVIYIYKLTTQNIINSSSDNVLSVELTSSYVKKPPRKTPNKTTSEAT